jgi:glycosyltransferase 2 family protein
VWEKVSRIFASQYFRVGVGLFLSVSALVFVSKNVNFQEVGMILKKTNLNFLGLGLVSVGINILCKVLRWRILLGKPGGKVGFTALLRAMLSGQLINLLIPGRIGDLSRVAFIGQDAGRAFVFGTIALEKLLETLAFTIMFLILLLSLPLPAWMEGSSFSLWGTVFLGSAALAGAVYYYEQLNATLFRLVKHLPRRIYEWLTPRLEIGLSSLKVLGGRKNLFWVTFFTIMVLGTAVFNNYIGMRALNIQLPVYVSVILLISLQIGIVAAASPGAIGIFETICILTLTFFGVDRALALGFGLLLHALVLFPQVIGGIFSLVWWGFFRPSQ